MRVVEGKASVDAKMIQMTWDVVKPIIKNSNSIEKEANILFMSSWSCYTHMV
jgi:hypothetical protein